jgi:sigma-70-like protein
MSLADLGELEEVKGLITRGQQVGVLTYTEIATATAELDLDEIDVEELHGLLERGEIDLVEEIDPATAASLNIERATLRSAPAARLRWISTLGGRPTPWRCSSRTWARCAC